MVTLEKMRQLSHEPFRMAAIIIVPLAQEVPARHCNADVAQLAEVESPGWGHDAYVAALERFDVIDQRVPSPIDATVNPHYQLLAHQGLTAVGRNAAHGEVEPFRDGQREHQTADRAVAELEVA